MPSATSRSGEKKGGGDAFDKRSSKHAAAAASVSTNASSDPSGDATTLTYPPREQQQGQSSDTQHAADIARATQNSLTDAVGAFSVAGPGFRAANANDSTTNNNTAGSSMGYNGSSAAAHASGHAHAHNYTADNLPPNIDIIAEATLVHPAPDDDDDDYDYEEDSNVDTLGLRNDLEANLGGAHPDSASVAVSAITSPYIPHPPSVVGPNGEEVHSREASDLYVAHCEPTGQSPSRGSSRPGRNQVGSSTQPTTGTGSAAVEDSGTGGGTGGGGGGNANSSPVEAVEAIAMDKRTLYACGTHITLQTWHWALLCVAVVACVAIPVGVVYGTKNNTTEPDQSFDWTPEMITSIVSPSVSGPGSFLPWEVLTADGRELGNPQARAIEWLANGGADIVTGPSLEAVEWRVQQRYILAVLYYSTGGETWKNQYGYLDNDTHECEWGGMLNNGWKSMDCTGGDGRVTLINLWQNDLRGTLPKELASLSDSLTALDLLTNQIGGTLPEELFALKKLTYLNLGYNQFQGTVSSALGELDQLTYLMLDNNDLSGTIPPALGKLTQLSGWLSLEGNRLHGTVPESFKDLTLATWIYVNYNDLEGSLEFLCEALTPVEAPGGVNANSGSPLLELWADIGEVECSCCNCCPFAEGTTEGVGEATGEEEEEGGAAGPYYVNEVVELEGTGEEGDATEGEGATEGTEEVAVEDGAATEDEGAGEEGT